MNIEEYKIKDERHELDKEYEQMKEAGLNLSIISSISKDSWHTVYKFPNGVRASVIHLPHAKESGIQDWTYEILAHYGGEEAMYRSDRKEDINTALETLCNYGIKKLNETGE